VTFDAPYETRTRVSALREVGHALPREGSKGQKRFIKSFFAYLYTSKESHYYV